MRWSLTTAWAQEASLRVRRFLGTCHVADFLWVSCPSPETFAAEQQKCSRRLASMGISVPKFLQDMLAANFKDVKSAAPDPAEGG